MPAGEFCPGLGRGFSHVREVPSLDVVARYFTDDDVPLLTAEQAAVVAGVKTRTIYQWRRRDYLRVRGLDDDGRELYDAAEVAGVEAAPRRRRKTGDVR